MATLERIEIRPQAGPQETALSSPADILIYGGAAGGGKTWALLLECVRHVGNKDFHAVIFRRTYSQITNAGGLWDETGMLYPLFGATSRESDLTWTFPSGATVSFSHLQHEQSKYQYQGAQIPLICFDELTHFTQSQFTYLLSRNRSMSGVRPYVRATTNPDADSWVKDFVGPWVDDEHAEYPYPAGKLRYFTQEAGKLIWVDPDWRDENGLPGKSITFIPASVHDNKILLATNPEYLANLRALDYVDQLRLLHGDWKVRPEAGKVFNRGWFEIVDAAPAEGETVRFWDFAATEKEQKGDDPDWTVGLRLKKHDGIYYIEDVVRERMTPPEIDRIAKNTAAQDGKGVRVGWEIEPGSSGVKVNRQLSQMFAGYDCIGVQPTGDKLQRAKPVAAQALAKNIKLVRGAWNSDFLKELHGFPDLPHDDCVDGLSGAFNLLTGQAGMKVVPNAANLYGSLNRTGALPDRRREPARNRGIYGSTRS